MSTETSIKECTIVPSSESPLPSIEPESQASLDKKLTPSTETSNQECPSQSITSVDVTYSLVYSDITDTSAQDKGPTSQVHIVGEAYAEDDGSHICMVYLHFRDVTCELTCLYHPPTGTFSAFEVEDGTMSGEMEDEGIAVEDVFIVAMQRRKKVDGEYVGEEVRDDNGNPFLFAFMDFGYSGRYPFAGRVYGKMVMPGEEVGEITLSKEERLRLNLEGDQVAETGCRS